MGEDFAAARRARNTKIVSVIVYRPNGAEDTRYDRPMRERAIAWLMTLGTAFCVAVLPCCRDPEAEQAARVAASAEFAQDAIPAMPLSLHEAVSDREEYLPSLQSIGEDWATPVSQMRAALIDAQPLVEKFMRAPVALQAMGDVQPPPVPEYTDEQVMADAHLEGFETRVVAASRLLRADAVRVWEAGDATGAANRMVASFELGRWLAARSPERNEGFGVLCRSLFEFEALVNDGLAEALDASEIHALRNAVPPDLQSYLWVKSGNADPRLIDALSRVSQAIGAQ
jgi:hypothetical protein